MMRICHCTRPGSLYGNQLIVTARMGLHSPRTIEVGRLNEGQPGEMPGGPLTSKPTWLDAFGRSTTSAFLFAGGDANKDEGERMVRMEKPQPSLPADTSAGVLTMAQQVAKVASSFQQQRTGHVPQAVTVVLSEDTLVVTLHGALSPAEKALAQTPSGAARVQEFHRQLFVNSNALLREEIKRITGKQVREAAAEVEPRTGAVVHAFTSGTMVQVFQLSGPISEGTWNTSGPGFAPAQPEGKP